MRSFGRFAGFCLLAVLVAGLSVGSFAAEEEQGDEAINVPIPVGKDAKGLKIPLYDQRGNLTMTLEMQRAEKIDENHMRMEGAIVQTYQNQGEPDLRISVPTSVLDLNTRVVTSETPVTIERRDFSLTGERMEFHLKSKKGRVTGNVKMLIYDRDNISAEKPAE